MIPIILLGGSGKRLWPISRENIPKQFLNLVSDKSLLQETIERMELYGSKNFILAGNEKHQSLLENHIKLFKKKFTLLFEPISKNTAPSILLSVLSGNYNDDQLFISLPSDHLIKDTNVFFDTLDKCKELARKQKIVAIGIEPSFPETNYGYIEKGEGLNQGYKILNFIEKPDLEVAKKLTESKKFLWNSGIFVFTKEALLNEFKKCSKTLTKRCSKLSNEMEIKNNRIFFDHELFRKLQDISFDKSLMEKTDEAAVVEMENIWSDLGNFNTLYESSPKDENNNVVKGNSLVVNSKNSYIYTEENLNIVDGIEDSVVISTKDVTFFSKKSNLNNLGKILENISKSKQKEINDWKNEYRPWGSFHILSVSEKFQIKKIIVNPGHKLSVQKHFKRSEHWIVISGKAKVQKGKNFYELGPDNHIFIKKEEVHSLENETSVPLEIIEIQTGNYFGEDDIVRLEDIYGRK